jgi:ParB family chromosome partitioning protein
MTDEEAATWQALKAEYDQLEADHAEADELPEDVDERLGEIETAMEALQDRPICFEPDELAIAGAFVSIDSSGRLRVERGYVRAEDEPVEEPDVAGEASETAGGDPAAGEGNDTVDPVPATEDEEDDGLKPLSDRLVAELTAHRTLALRDALARCPQVAFLVALHALALRLFYRYESDSCIEIEPRSTGLGTHAPGLGDTIYARSIDHRTETWAKALPKMPEALWDALAELDGDNRNALFAHCVAMCVNAVHDPYQRRPRALAHADVLAATLKLDMGKAGWAPTAEKYLGRVTKARILEGVREASGAAAADRIAVLKKPDMVAAAEELLTGTGWLPEPLRTPQLAEADDSAIELVETGEPANDAGTGPAPRDGEAQSAENGGEPAMGEDAALDEDDAVTGSAFARTAAE